MCSAHDFPPYDELAVLRANLPKPGSQLAAQQGCFCPTLENNHGMQAPEPPNGWHVFPACPLHGHAARAAEAVAL